MNAGKYLYRFVVLCLAALAALQPTASYARDAAAASPDRQILVMVRIAPSHYRPTGDYGGAYGDQTAQSTREHLARRVARQYGLKLLDNWPMPTIGVDCFVMLVPDGRSTSAAAEQVSHDSDVAWAQPMAVFSARGTMASHNDPLYAAEPAAAQWHLADLHRIATGRGVKVAVIDSGIEAAHPDLAGQIMLSRNFVAGQPAAVEQHGTGVAGIIAAKADNGIGIAGVAPGARLLALRACWQNSGCDRVRYLEPGQSHLLCRRSARGCHQSQSQRSRGPAACRAAEDGAEARQRCRHGLRPEACRRRIPSVNAGCDRRLRHIIGTVAQGRLHCARTGRSHDSARRTMVSRQWQLFCRSACQRADRFDSGAGAFRLARPGLRSARRRRNRRLRHIGEGSGRL